MRIFVLVLVMMSLFSGEAAAMRFKPVSDPSFNGKIKKISCQTFAFTVLDGERAASPLSDGGYYFPNSFVLDVTQSRINFLYEMPNWSKDKGRKIMITGYEYSPDNQSKRLIAKFSDSIVVVDFWLGEVGAMHISSSITNNSATDSQIYFGSCMRGE